MFNPFFQIPGWPQKGTKSTNKTKEQSEVHNETEPVRNPFLRLFVAKGFRRLGGEGGGEFARQDEAERAAKGGVFAQRRRKDAR